MDKKYISTNIALSKPIHEQILRVRAMLTKRFGFEPSMAQTIAHLCNHYERTFPLDDRPCAK